MHHIVFGINFLFHSVNLARPNHSPSHFSHPTLHTSRLTSPIITTLTGHYSHSSPLQTQNTPFLQILLTIDLTPPI